MSLSLICGIAAGLAAVAGIGAGTHGAVQMKRANETTKLAVKRHNNNMDRFEACNKEAANNMDKLGKLELNILSSFQQFSDVIEKIQIRPDFKDFSCGFVELPHYDKEELSKVSVGADVLMGGIGGAALGTVGGFAAAGATTAAVMAHGTASTGVAITSLHGVAQTNAIFAALGGGALAAGGGGMALGTTIFGVTTAGVGILVGGIIFNIAGSTTAGKAQESWDEMLEAEKEINGICNYLNRLDRTAIRYTKTLTNVNAIYSRHLAKLDEIVNINKKEDWNEFTDQERLVTMNTVLLVQLLFKMCQIQIVLKGEKDGLNKVNKDAVKENIEFANKILEKRGLVEPSKSNRTSGSKSNRTSGWKYSADESYCFAVTALLYYFARCDGNISEAEQTVVSTTLNEIYNKHTLSDKAVSEIEKIQKVEPFTFIHFRKYLMHISFDALNKLAMYIDGVVSASDGISLAEKEAQIEFENYVAYRKLTK